MQEAQRVDQTGKRVDRDDGASGDSDSRLILERADGARVDGSRRTVSQCELRVA